MAAKKEESQRERGWQLQITFAARERKKVHRLAPEAGTWTTVREAFSLARHAVPLFLRQLQVKVRLKPPFFLLRSPPTTIKP